MIACPDQSIYPYASYGINYCPDYGEEDELRNNWYSDDNYSILRLTIEECQEKDSSVPCATKEEIDRYAYENVMIVQAKFGYLNL
jgi:hypothetical protein